MSRQEKALNEWWMALVVELRRGRELTYAAAKRAYDEAEESELSSEEIDRIVEEVLERR